MKFRVGNKVVLRLDNTGQIYVIVDTRRAVYAGPYDIATLPDSYKYEEAWEEDLIGIEEPNEIFKKVL